MMLEYFDDDGHWTRGRYEDGNGGHCLVGALLHLSRKHRLPRAPAIALLQDAMPRPGLPLVHFNDTCCVGVVIDTTAVPDPDVLIGYLRAGFDEVLALA